MVEISARRILNAIEGGDIEAQTEGERIEIFINRKRVVSTKSLYSPTILITESTFCVTSITWPGVQIQADDLDDAWEIAHTMAFLLKGDRRKTPLPIHRNYPSR